MSTITTIQDSARGVEAVAAASRRPAFMQIFSISSFRFLWLGNGISYMGEKGLDVAVAWLVLEMTGSQMWMGIIKGVPALSIVFFSIAGGVLADRNDKRVLLMKARLGLACLVFAAAVLVSAGMIELWHLVLVVMLFIGTNTIDIMNSRTLVFEVVGKGSLLSATSLNSIARNLGTIAGPFLVGIVIARFSVDAALYVICGVYLAAFATLLKVKIGSLASVSVKSKTKDARQAHPLMELAEGFAYIRRTPQAAWLIAIAATLPFAGVYFGMIPVYAKDILNVGAEGLGMMMAMFGVGAVISSAAMSVRGNLPKKGLLMVVTGLIFGAGMLALAFSPSYPLTLVSIVFTGAAGVFWMNTTNTLIQTSAVQEMRGRVVSIFMMGVQMMSLGWLIG
ncbi:MAG: MFS transporter, partial [Chloroflexi bacterium]|nr:MFS transporter [Chloroflexota bacterium]